MYVGREAGRKYLKISGVFGFQPDMYSKRGGDFMENTTLLKIIILMVVLKVGVPVVINLTIDGTTHRIEIV
jgi:hypothetical protein